MVWHSLGWDERPVGRLLQQMTLLPQFPMVLLTPDVPHGWDSGRNTCCVSHDQTLFTTGTWWARQIEGIQVKVEARRHLPSQFFWRMAQIL